MTARTLLRRLRCRFGWHSGGMFAGAFFCDHCSYSTVPDYSHPEMQAALRAVIGNPEIRRVVTSREDGDTGVYTWEIDQ